MGRKIEVAMKIKRNAAAALCILAQLFAIPSALAWNDFGHMSVAFVAYKHLTPKTKARVNALLKLNPYYETWISQIPQSGTQDDKDAEIFMLAATWPDLIKKDPAYTSDGSSDGNRPEGPEAKQNLGYKDHLMHKYWHFYDLPFSVGKTKTPKIPSPNAQTEIAVCRKTLASKASDELKSYDLSWLLHIVGDVHQPMHCATRVSHDAPFGDNGGNDVMVNYNGLTNMRLHGFWDGSLGTGTVESAMKFADALPAANVSKASDRNAKDWMKESFDLAQTRVYISPIRPGNGPFDLNSQYQQNAFALSKERVALGGERLANILNRELN